MNQEAELLFAPTALRRVEEWLADYDRHELDIAKYGMSVSGGWRITSLRDLQTHRDKQKRERDRLLAGGLADRGPRKMPSLKRMAAYHDLGDRPRCLGCHWRPPVGTWADASGLLERAHIVDRVFDGLDALANLAPLCSRCHKTQPIFRPGDEEEALEWFGLPVERRHSARTSTAAGSSTPASASSAVASAYGGQ